jgi:hypothetical protein
MRTREHHFRQEWSRGKKKWTAEALCLDCHCWSYRSYTCVLRACTATHALSRQRAAKAACVAR